MNTQDEKINNKVIISALIAVIVIVLVAFCYSYTLSYSEIKLLRNEKVLMAKDLTLMKADLARLIARNEVDEIDVEKAKYEVQQLQDSVGRLNFTIEKQREYKTELKRVEAQNDSLRRKNSTLLKILTFF